MKPRALILKWSAEAETMRRRGAMVDGAALIGELLADLRAALAVQEDQALNLQEAARESGYSADYLGRLVRTGKIANAGRPNAPRIRRRDLPRKASTLPSLVGHPNLLTRGQIARSVVESEKGDPR